MRFSLRIKAAAVLVVVVVTAAALGGWISNHLLSEWTSQTQTDHAGRVAEMLRISVADMLARADDAALRRKAAEFISFDGVLAVSILGADGRVLARAGGGEAADIPPDDGSAVEMAYTRRIDRSRLYVARPVLAGDGDNVAVVGSVRLALDSSPAATRLRRAQITMGVMICLFVLAFVPLSHVLVFKVLIGPIQRLVHATGRLAAGDYAARADTGGRDEVGALARSFNAMAEQIDSQHRQLLTYSEDLEDEVEQRTAELNAANARLRSEMNDHQEFLRAVSHDLNAPLRNIGGMTAMLMMKYGDRLDPDVVARLERIAANVEAQTDLINDLLELSRIGTRRPHPEWVDMDELLAQVAAAFEYDLRRRDIRLRIAPNMPRLYIERNHVRQVFGNLVDNAVKYMGSEDDGRIEITYEDRGDRHVFHVADNGIGVAAEDCRRIFVVFRRATNAPADTAGKGVGLAGVSAIATKYGGRAWVDSEPHVGSVFHVSFDRQACEPGESQEEFEDHDDSPTRQDALAVHTAG